MTEELLPQITLTGSGADLDPAQVLAHALRQYQAGVRAEAEKRVLAGPVDLGTDILSSILMEVAGGHLNLFRITAGVALRVRIKQAARRQQLVLSEMEAAQQADDAAMNLGAYLAATSSNAVMDGYHLNRNLKLPPKEAARRAVRAFGLTVPQMRTVFRLRDEGVNSSEPGAWRSRIEAFIERAFGLRLRTLVDNSLRQVEADAVQRGWEQGLANGTIPITATKIWVTALDERTCPVCAPMDGVAVGITERFELPDGNKVKAPPVHVNCRCTVELAYEGDEISKAEQRWDPRLHPRAQHGQFGRKPKPFKEPEPEALEVVNRLLAGVRLANAPGAAGARLRDVGAQSGARLAGGPGLAAGPGLNQAGLAAAPGLAGARVVETGVRSHAVLGGQTVNLGRLNMAHQLKVAAVAADVEGRQSVELPPERDLVPISRHYVAFATHGNLDIDDPSRGRGKAQVVTPLHFVDRSNQGDVRDALDDAMAGLDSYLRYHGVDVPMGEAERAPDPGIVEAAAELRTQMLATPRGPKGEVTLSVTPEDAQEAWRAVLAPPGAGTYRSRYLVEAFDETGIVVGATEVTADTVAALTNVGVDHPDLPRVVVAPHGGWSIDSGFGATEPAPGEGGTLVTGAFRWSRNGRIIVLTPDIDAYQRANPAN